MENNNSPKPVFDTDKQSTYFLTTLPSHTRDQVKAFVTSTLKDVIVFCEVDNNQASEVV
ncbi:hypothetical protein N9164_03450 [Draconibacterium sp.]|nr:hypothetical protein [Draconibacterium sp.]